MKFSYQLTTGGLVNLFNLFNGVSAICLNYQKVHTKSCKQVHVTRENLDVGNLLVSKSKQFRVSSMINLDTAFPSVN